MLNVRRISCRSLCMFDLAIRLSSAEKCDSNSSAGICTPQTGQQLWLWPVAGFFGPIPVASEEKNAKVSINFFLCCVCHRLHSFCDSRRTAELIIIFSSIFHSSNHWIWWCYIQKIQHNMTSARCCDKPINEFLKKMFRGLFSPCFPCSTKSLHFVNVKKRGKRTILSFHTLAVTWNISRASALFRMFRVTLQITFSPFLWLHKFLL